MEEIKVVCYELQGETFYAIYPSYQIAFQTFLALVNSNYVRNPKLMENTEFWSTVHAVIRYQRKSSRHPLFEICMTEADLTQKKISLLFDQEIVYLDVVGGQANVG